MSLEIQTSFRCPAELHLKLCKVAEAEGRSFGSVIRRRLTASLIDIADPRSVKQAMVALLLEELGE